MKKEFDCYIFIDYSVNLIGYMIIEKCKIKEFITKIGKFSHYNELKYKSSYLRSIKKVIEKNSILSYFKKLVNVVDGENELIEYRVSRSVSPTRREKSRVSSGPVPLYENIRKYRYIKLSLN